MRLPEIAARLRELAIELDCSELSELADEISRRKGGQRAPATSAPMTDQIRNEIKEIHQKYPNLSQQKIASKVGVNPGRVSETLRGKRT